MRIFRSSADAQQLAKIETRCVMKRAAVPSILIAVVLLAVAVIPSPKKVPRIGYLSTGDPVSDSTRAEGIRLALRELGYIEGKNIATEYRYAEGKLDRVPELAAELVRLKVDIIVVAEGARRSWRPRMRQDDSHRYDRSWARSCRGRLH